MSALRPALAVVLTLAALPAMASSTNKSSPVTGDHDCSVTYALFEYAVPHVDLAACPASMGLGEQVFCRAAVGTDMLHVYAFEEEGFQCLKALRSFEGPEFEIIVH